MAANFKIGDIVRLKSGGPDMTIIGQSEYSGWHCGWFAGGKSQAAWFPRDALVHADEVEGDGKKR